MASSFTIKNSVQQLFPAYFALVMSTGIVSIASHLLQFDFVGNLLFWINNMAFGVLFILYGTRLVLFFSSFKADLSSHAKGAGFLSIVAASGILGVQYVLLKQNFAVAILLWVFGICVWLVLIYTFLILIFIKKEKPSLEEGINGSWLLLVVSSQSLSILGTLIAPHLSLTTNLTFFITLTLYLLGFLLYIILITIIIYRLGFFALKAEEVTPTYWIDTGAAAISTLAGATLAKSVVGVLPFQNFIPIIDVLNLLAWASATWWIPIVFVLELWRHKQIPLQYHPSYWSMVFPLGMYTVATWRLAESLQFSFLQPVSRIFIYIAWMAWLVTFLGMCWSMVKKLRQAKSPQHIAP